MLRKRKIEPVKQIRENSSASLTLTSKVKQVESVREVNSGRLSLLSIAPPATNKEEN